MIMQKQFELYGIQFGNNILQNLYVNSPDSDSS